MKNKSHIIWWLGIKQKMSTKRSDEYVTIYIYDYDVTWNESVSNSFDITFSNNGTQINFADIINVWGCSCSMQTRTDLSFRFFSSVRKTFSSMRKDMAAFLWSFLQNMKTQVVWTIHVPLEGFAGYTPVSFCFNSFYEQLEDYGVNGIWLMCWKPLRHKRPFVC